MIELLLITFRWFLSFLPSEQFHASRRLVPARTAIVGSRRIVAGASVPHDDVWLSVSHVLGRFGAPPGRFPDDCPFMAIGSEQLDQKRHDLADSLPVPLQSESS